MNSKLRRKMKVGTGFGQRGWISIGRKTRCGWGQANEKENGRTDTVPKSERTIPMERG